MILPIIGRSDVRIGKQVSRDRQPISSKLLHEPKTVDLVYDTKISQVRETTVKSVPNFGRTMPRKDILAGVNGGSRDPTGHEFVDDATIGLEGQGYGLASFKKGLKTTSICNVLKANASSIELKERRKYEQLPFSKVLGRGQVDIGGRRTDMGLTANSLSRSDLMDMPEIDSIDHSDFLPNSVRK